MRVITEARHQPLEMFRGEESLRRERGPVRKLPALLLQCHDPAAPKGCDRAGVDGFVRLK